ncbi:type VII secretion protein EssB [Weissella oryzae SG25]|uniref:Type VII secretion protein EssB n=1 Tax=Weissella oryzae (strain DSM 25784 / JCM 18191 / LMG 30913 / SG25) TaxID=1329250 RepID=A0A069CYK0_WEIOS|nr:type VII secretion protein EssB [Weissella oryzae]GAK30166.1 type VII secretion protein EssB [Weissella oryzae SG25]
MEIQVGKELLDITRVKNEVTVVLNASQYRDISEAMLDSLVSTNSTFIAGKGQIKDSQLYFAYELPKGAVSLHHALAKQSMVERLRLAQKAIKLGDYFNSDLIPVLNPINLFVVAGDLKVAHRGWRDLWVPMQNSDVADLAALRALVASILNSKLTFEDAMGDAKVVRDTFSRAILNAASLDELRTLVDNHLQITLNEQESSKELVKKATFKLYKYGFMLAIAVVVAVGSYAVYQGIEVGPKQERVIASQADFMTNDYDGTTKTLENDQPESLPKSAQYVLAASYVNLDSLTSAQKKIVLNNLSQRTETNILLYWIYLGRGDFDKALSLAKNVGDDQLILHAYTKLYDSTQANTKMSGNKKQELLATYKEQINKYVKQLGGSTDGVEK